MNLVERIEFDEKCLKGHFLRLFELESEDNQKVDSEHFVIPVKPDMVSNIYGFLEFWLTNLCDYHQKTKKSVLSYKDIKGDNDLHARHKFLEFIIGINLKSKEIEYRSLQELRKVRNVFIHSGGHIIQEKFKEYSKLDGVEVSGTLLYIEESFIWKKLNDAKTFLCYVAQS